MSRKPPPKLLGQNRRAPPPFFPQAKPEEKRGKHEKINKSVS